MKSKIAALSTTKHFRWREDKATVMLSLLTSILLWTPTATAPAAEPEASSPADSQIASELQKLQRQLDEQTRRIDRLYNALGPHLEQMEAEAARLAKQNEEDERLALERIADLSNQNLTRRGAGSPAAPEFAVITKDGGVQIYDAKGAVKQRLDQPRQTVTALAYAPSGKELLTGTQAGELCIWNLEENVCATLRTNLGRVVDHVTWLGPDKVVWGNYVNYWKSGEPTNRDRPAGAVIDRASKTTLWEFKATLPRSYDAISGTASGKVLATREIPGNPRAAFLLDGATGEIRHTCYDSEHSAGPLSVCLSPNDRTLAVGYAPWDIILWNAQTGARQRLLDGHRNWVVSLAFSADSQRLISGGGDSTARVWDVTSGREIGRLRFEGASTYTWSVGISPKGDLAFALTDEGQLVVAKVPAASQLLPQPLERK